MSQYGYEDFLKDEARFFKLWHERVCKPALLGMIEQIDKAWDEAFQQAKTNHDAVPEARADLPDERPPNAVSANGGTPGAASRDGSGTGNTPEPVAWAVWHISEEAPGRIAYASPIKSLRGTGETRDGEEFIPLYGKPTLTDEEREAIELSISKRLDLDAIYTLRKLLERLG